MKKEMINNDETLLGCVVDTSLLLNTIKLDKAKSRKDKVC